MGGTMQVLIAFPIIVIIIALTETSMHTTKLIRKQECTPVKCLPTAVVAISGGGGVWIDPPLPWADTARQTPPLPLFQTLPLYHNALWTK